MKEFIKQHWKKFMIGLVLGVITLGLYFLFKSKRES